jgi:hypothetical protein
MPLRPWMRRRGCTVCKNMMMRCGLRCGQGIEIDSPHSRPAAVSNAARASRGPGLGTTPMHATRKLVFPRCLTQPTPGCLSVGITYAPHSTSLHGLSIRTWQLEATQKEGANLHSRRHQNSERGTQLLWIRHRITPSMEFMHMHYCSSIRS